MSPKLPRVTAADLLRALKKDGWYESHQVGSHLTLRHLRKSGSVIVPMHAGKTLRLGLLSKIIRDAGLTADEFRGLL